MCLGEMLFLKRVKRATNNTKSQRALGNKALLLLMLWVSGGGEVKVKRSLRALAQGEISAGTEKRQ